MLLFQVKYYTIKTDIIRYYLLSDSTSLKLCKPKQKRNFHKFLTKIKLDEYISGESLHIHNFGYRLTMLKNLKIDYAK